MRLLITGANGFLGYRLSKYFENKYEVYAMNHQELDVTEIDSTRQIIQKLNPDVLIHCAGLSNKSICDADPDYAYKVIVTGTSNIARLCEEHQTKMIFCSSDQVYEGASSVEKHKETEHLNPTTVYAKCKYEAEKSALTIWEETVCLRLTAMYDVSFDINREHQNLLSYVLRDIREKNEMYYAENEYRGFTNVQDVIKNLSKTFELPGGIYNFGSENDLSSFELMKSLMEKIYQSGSLIKTKESDFVNLCMDTAKIQNYGIQFNNTHNGLADSLIKIKNMLEGEK